MSELNAKFDAAMFGIYRRAKDEAHYPANIFLRMLNEHGGLATAKTLINATKPSDGYRALWQRKRLDLTVEAVVVEDRQWHHLFTENELAQARKRLIAYEYIFKDSLNSNS
jgi:hypothetical protein